MRDVALNHFDIHLASAHKKIYSSIPSIVQLTPTQFGKARKFPEPIAFAEFARTMTEEEK